jgi:ZIP family zinc transporter
MLEALLYGLLGGSSLVLGAALGLFAHVPKRVIGLVTAFGSGVLISAVAFELTAEAYRLSGAAIIAAGLAAGAFAFYGGNAAISARGGGNDRKRSHGGQGDQGAAALVLGAVLDGIPESAVIGASLIGGATIGVPVVAAVFISNVPESLAAATGLRQHHSARFVIGLWVAVMVVSGVAAALGYGLLSGASDDALALCQAFAAGAILTMLADTMMPEAIEEGGPAAGLVTVLGFAVAFLLSKLD